MKYPPDIIAHQPRNNIEAHHLVNTVSLAS